MVTCPFLPSNDKSDIFNTRNVAVDDYCAMFYDCTMQDDGNQNDESQAGIGLSVVSVNGTISEQVLVNNVTLLQGHMNSIQLHH